MKKKKKGGGGKKDRYTSPYQRGCGSENKIKEEGGGKGGFVFKRKKEKRNPAVFCLLNVVFWRQGGKRGRCFCF
ncbi:hypothetical protein, partial [Staphylococcus aureus]|uniref:hypothetical protein n=1 Tax=Staphylococcus aureus TaxID=1280 RepID=UPI00210D4B83